MLSDKHRRSIRLSEYDYSQPGAYFITLVTNNHKCFFGNILDGVMDINDVGKMVVGEWLRLPKRFQHIEVDYYMIMPNHFHGILVINRELISRNAGLKSKTNDGDTLIVKEQFGVPVKGSIPTIIRSFKSSVTQRWQYMKRSDSNSLWQRNYYEHIIRNDEELNRIREYILSNPIKWDLDRENPVNDPRRGTGGN